MSTLEELSTTKSSYRDSAPAPRSSGAAGRIVRKLIGFALVLALLGGAAWGAVQYFDLFGGAEGVMRLTHTVARGDLVVTVTEDGNLESFDNNEIRCLVAGGSTIQWIVPDGTFVKKKEKLVELNSAPIDEQILIQQIAFERARAVRDQVKNDLAAAKIALQEYEEGTFIRDQKAAQSLVTVQKEALRTAENTLVFTERMFRKGYVTKLQLEGQKFAVDRAKLDLEGAETALKVLNELTSKRMTNDLKTLIATNTVKLDSEQRAFELEESRLTRLKTQKENCLITAPQDGMVVYANESSSFFGSDRPKVEEGAAVREGQVILRVPDLSKMQAKVTVHESKIDSVEVGMPASIRIKNRKFNGYVTAVANQPDSGSRYSSGVKTYATLVSVEGRPSDLKPGMTAQVEILIEERKNVLTAPVQCFVEQYGKFFAWKMDGSHVVKTEVKLKPGDDRSIQILSGLNEGDVIVQNPPERAEGAFGGDSRRQFGGGRRGGAPDGPAGTPTGDAPLPGTSGGAGPGGGPRGPGGRRPGGDVSADLSAGEAAGGGAAAAPRPQPAPSSTAAPAAGGQQ